ncbi:P-type DNA transfer protein VirB5 [Erythrobacter westpacificensis]|jgi:type IV secretion system protein VirB5|uniref:P-type DNA transfer protein VirB5 n=1 Tax=Erythrobacter westpacificensis TaxID=1055231 RepID=A0ABP9KQA1_9SPHN
MKRTIAAAVSALALSVSSPAMAQGIPVFDSSSLLKQIEQIRNTMQMIEQGRQQIAEAQRLYNDLNKLTDISSIADQLKSDSLRTLGVDVNSLERMARGDFGAGNSGYSVRSNAIYQDLMERIGAVPDNARGGAEQNARMIAMDKAMAQGMGEAAMSRGEGLEELRARLATASTAKEVADLQARIQLETAAMMNDQLRVEAMERARKAEAGARLAESLAESSRALEDRRARAAAAAEGQ